MSQPGTHTVEIWSDVACPWCWLGKRRFERALADFPGRDRVCVVYRPFQLDPALPRDPAAAVPASEYLAARFGPGIRAAQRRLDALAAELGLEYRWERVLAVGTFDAHRLLWLAEREGGPAVQGSVEEALLRAHFQEGRNLADGETLVAIAAAAGLDPSRIRAALAAGEGEHEVRAAIDGARAQGITAVPTFVFDGRRAVAGALEPEAFLALLRELEPVAQ